MAKVETSSRSVRVAVVDDDEDTHFLLKDILQSAENFSFAGGFLNAAEAIIEVPRLRPDLTLMDIRLPDLNGVECTKRLKQAMPYLKIVIVTGIQGTGWIDACLEAGAMAYLVKPFLEEQLLATLSFAAANQNETEFVRPPVKYNFFRAKASAGSRQITLHENEVLKKLADGLLYKEIADKLGISYSAVHKCLDRIYKKLGVNNRSEAIRAWIDSGRP